jgi:hypothetical protein
MTHTGWAVTLAALVGGAACGGETTTTRDAAATVLDAENDAMPLAAPDAGDAAVGTCCVSGPQGCSCTHENGCGPLVTCSVSSVPSPSLCCANPEWPEGGLGCECAELGCVRYVSPDGASICTCEGNLGYIGDGGALVTACAGDLCCLGPHGLGGTHDCTCYSWSALDAGHHVCPPGEQTVPSCSESSLTCEEGTVEVIGCR